MGHARTIEHENDFTIINMKSIPNFALTSLAICFLVYVMPQIRKWWNKPEPKKLTPEQIRQVTDKLPKLF